MTELVRPEELFLTAEEIETSLRPQSLDDFIGNEELKGRLRIAIESTKVQDKTLGHILLAGPPGLGKTSLAQVVANELGVEMISCLAQNISKPGDIAALLVSLEDGDVFFLDEIHRLKPKCQELLYTAMEDYRIDLKLGSGPTTEIIPVDLPCFTLIGATTKTGDIEKPMMDRFSFDGRLELYTEEDLQKIVVRAAAAQKPELYVTKEATEEIAKRSWGTPRIAIKLLKKLADYAMCLGYEYTIDGELAEVAFELEGIDSLGLEAVHRRYLTTLIEEFSGGPVGVINLSAHLREDTNTIQQVEENLIQAGMVFKINRGRMVKKKALEHLGYKVPENWKDNIRDHV